MWIAVSGAIGLLVGVWCGWRIALWTVKRLYDNGELAKGPNWDKKATAWGHKTYRNLR
jgi:hypothetical protein